MGVGEPHAETDELLVSIYIIKPCSLNNDGNLEKRRHTEWTSARTFYSSTHRMSR